MILQNQKDPQDEIKKVIIVKKEMYHLLLKAKEVNLLQNQKIIIVVKIVRKPVIKNQILKVVMIQNKKVQILKKIKIIFQ